MRALDVVIRTSVILHVADSFMWTKRILSRNG